MSQRFKFIATPLAGLYRVEYKPIIDHRGFLNRFFCAEEFKEIGLDRPISQMNHTLTREKGSVRGMHFQHPPHAETKIVTCLQGEIFDVAVDLRKNSPTFLEWHAEILNADAPSSLYIPEGFAHGFQTLGEDCKLLYLHSESYTPEFEGALNALDPKLSIKWPLEISERSERDQNHPFLNEGFQGVKIQ